MIELVKDGIIMRVQTEGQASAFLNNGYKKVEKAESEEPVAEQPSKSGKSAKQ
ncbi:hypothetical protein C8E03_108185 [Lachnotalea glycerini]|uniref:Uncharacterized protein n=1 Tax=Lachnotalea glycerini TaxID=1763509 RepID=A0A318EME1_9FIRM|nr:hypothetical protein [Lachnotalea glycerini]PXV88458.1 hypothetical protein C8E03_108185 [Lachnotalea glycerini]